MKNAQVRRRQCYTPGSHSLAKLVLFALYLNIYTEETAVHQRSIDDVLLPGKARPAPCP